MHMQFCLDQRERREKSRVPRRCVVMSRGYSTPVLIHKRTIFPGWKDNLGTERRSDTVSREPFKVLSISLGCSFAWRKRGTIVEMLPYRYAGGSSRRGKEGGERSERENKGETKRNDFTMHANTSVSVVEFSFCENYLVTRAMKYERNFASLSEDKTSESIGHRDSGGNRRLSLPPSPRNEMYR